MPPTETETLLDVSVLHEMISWIKALTAVGVSPDAAAEVTSKFFIAACDMTTEDDEYADE